MIVPPPDEGYSWPSRPAGARGAPRRPPGPVQARAASRLGSVLGVAHILVLFGLWAYLRVHVGLVLAALVLPAVIAAGATASPRARPFARGFLVSVICCVVLLTVASCVLAYIQITTGGPKPAPGTRA